MKFKNALIALFFTFFSCTAATQETGLIPFKMVKGSIIVEVNMADSSYNFVLDTGGYLSIAKEVQEAFKLPISSSVTVSDANENEMVFEKAIVPILTIGKLVFKEREAIIIDDYYEYPNRCFQISGMIGRDFLIGNIIYFDYANLQLRITADASRIAGLNAMNAARMKTSKRGLPSIKVEVNGKKQFIELDSGSSDVISFKTVELEEMLQKNASENKIRTFEGIFSFGVAGKSYTPTKRYSLEIIEWAIGEEVFNGFDSNLSKPSAPRIGAGILPYGIVAVDWKNKRFYFEKYDDTPVESQENFGFDIGKIKGEHTIKWVEKDSEAERQGLKYGDIVLGVNGQNPAILEECTCYINGYGYEAEDQVELLIRKESGEMVSLMVDKQ